MTVFSTQAKLFIFFTFPKASVNSEPQSGPICFIYKIWQVSINIPHLKQAQFMI